MSEEKWLRQAADEIRKEGHYGWGNTCEQAADRIAELEETLEQAVYAHKVSDENRSHWQIKAKELEQQLAKLRGAAKKLCGSVKETGGSVSVIGTAELVAVAALLNQGGE